MSGVLCRFCGDYVDLNDGQVHFDVKHSDMADNVEMSDDSQFDSLVDYMMSGNPVEPPLTDVGARKDLSVSLYADLEVRMDDMYGVATRNTGSGAMASQYELKVIFNMVDKRFQPDGMTLDRTQFLVDLCHMLIITDASGQADMGSAVLAFAPPEGDVTGAPPRRRTVEWMTILDACNEETAAFGHQTTARRLARGLGQTIRSLLAENEEFKRYFVTGIPKSIRWNVDPKHFWVVLSFARYIFPSNWSAEQTEINKRVIANTVVPRDDGVDIYDAKPGIGMEEELDEPRFKAGRETRMGVKRDQKRNMSMVEFMKGGTQRDSGFVGGG